MKMLLIHNLALYRVKGCDLHHWCVVNYNIGIITEGLVESSLSK
jgi:hypothetical protein